MKKYRFLLLAAAGLISWAAYAGETVIPETEQCVVVLGEAAVFVGGTNDLTAWASETTPRKYRLTVFDSAGKKAIGYLGSVGRREELGPEMLLDGEMELFAKDGRLVSLWWARDRCKATMEKESLRPGTAGKAAVKVTVKDGKNPWGANGGNLSETIPIENERLYKLSAWVKNGTDSDSMFLKVQDVATGESIASPVYKGKEWKEQVLYFVPSQIPITSRDVWVYLFANGADNTFGYGDDILFREVVSGGRNTAGIYPDRDGSDPGWAVIDEGFMPYPISKCIVEEAN